MSNKTGIAKLLPDIARILMKYKLTGSLEPFSVSIDTTAACNLRCHGCYFFRDESEPYSFNRTAKEQQLSDDDWLEKIRELKREYTHLIHATWVGGEPFLRERLLQKGTRYFPLNWIVTNGTLPFSTGLADNTTFIVSLDGPEEQHDSIRGEGNFARTLSNIQKTDERVYAHSVISQKNESGAENLVEQLYKTTRLE